MTIESMIKDLMASGYSQVVIAKRVGVSQPTIHRASKGGAIMYDAGKSIERFHAEIAAAKAAA